MSRDDATETRPRPEPVDEGTVLENLSVIGGPQLPQAILTAAKLHYEWDTDNQGAIEPPTDGNRSLQSTGTRRNISPGVHSVTVRLADEHGRTVVSTKGHRHDGDRHDPR